MNIHTTGNKRQFLKENVLRSLKSHLLWRGKSHNAFLDDISLRAAFRLDEVTVEILSDIISLHE